MPWIRNQYLSVAIYEASHHMLSWSTKIYCKIENLTVLNSIFLRVAHNTSQFERKWEVILVHKMQYMYIAHV